MASVTTFSLSSNLQNQHSTSIPQFSHRLNFNFILPTLLHLLPLLMVMITGVYGLFFFRLELSVFGVLRCDWCKWKYVECY